MKDKLIEKINLELLGKGFTVKNINLFFDILAKKQDKILLIKILEDANSVNERAAFEMRSLASFVDASALIISNKAGTELEDDVVYSRFGVLTINPETLSNCLENNLPFLKSTRAGLTASLNKNKLNELREDFSLNDLASKLGVSRRMVVKYESGADINHKRILKIYEAFGNIFSEINPLNIRTEIIENFSDEFGTKYSSLGFKVSNFSRAPFNLAAKKSDEIILTKIGDNFNEKLIELAEMLEVDDLVIFTKKKPKDIPALKKEEFLEIEKANELIKIVREF